MIYLSGVKNAAISDDLASGRIGFLRTPANGNRLDGAKVWALDNGAFTKKYPGDEAYLRLLSSLDSRKADCLFVAVPDVVGDGGKTLEMFPRMAKSISALGWPVALVGQDGMENLPIPWENVDWLFVGGSTDWKLGAGAADLISQAKAHGKRVHVGRVNSARRFAHFAHLGADSADGTILAFGPDVNTIRVRKWLRDASASTENRCKICATKGAQPTPTPLD